MINYDNNVEIIKSFVKGLRRNYNGVINSSKYEENNGIVEGTIRRLKSIKVEMFGKGCFELLKNKVMYRLLFF